MLARRYCTISKSRSATLQLSPRETASQIDGQKTYLQPLASMTISLLRVHIYLSSVDLVQKYIDRSELDQVSGAMRKWIHEIVAYKEYRRRSLGIWDY